MYNILLMLHSSFCYCSPPFYVRKHYGRKQVCFLQAINESGCDALIDVRVSYKYLDHSETWTDVNIELADQTQVTITGLSYDEYAVKLTATNNEHVSASSEILTINLATSE